MQSECLHSLEFKSDTTQLEVKILSETTTRKQVSDEDFIVAWQNEEFESAQAVADHLNMKVASAQARARSISENLVNAGFSELREFPKRTVTKKDEAYWAALAAGMNIPRSDESSDDS